MVHDFQKVKSDATVRWTGLVNWTFSHFLLSQMQYLLPVWSCIDEFIYCASTFKLPKMILMAWLSLHHSHYKLKAALTRVERLFKCLLIPHSKGRGGVLHALQLMSGGEQNLKVKTQSTNRKWFVANEHRRASPLNSDPQSPSVAVTARRDGERGNKDQDSGFEDYFGYIA